jgi:hypothetical protein
MHCIAYSLGSKSVGMDTLGRTSYFRRGALLGCGWPTAGRMGATASLELSTSTGVVALLVGDGGRDDRSDRCSDMIESDEEEFGASDGAGAGTISGSCTNSGSGFGAGSGSGPSPGSGPSSSSGTCSGISSASGPSSGSGDGAGEGDGAVIC